MTPTDATPKHFDIEDKNQVVISPEDCKECAKFFEFFEIPVPEPLKAAIDAFVKDPSFVNQNELKFRLAEVISTSEHPIFADEVFAQIRPETREVHEGLAFERKLEEELTSK